MSGADWLTVITIIAVAIDVAIYWWTDCRWIRARELAPDASFDRLAAMARRLKGRTPPTLADFIRRPGG